MPIPYKRRGGLIENEHRRTQEMQQDMQQSRLHGRWRMGIAAVVWAVLAALPCLFVGRPTPHMLGQAAPVDIVSRVDFEWNDSQAARAALEKLENSFARVYTRTPQSQWRFQHAKIEEFLSRIARAGRRDEAEKIAAEMDMGLSVDQIQNFWSGAIIARNDPVSFLEAPLRSILDDDLFEQGVLAKERYEAERGRTIEIRRGDGSSFKVMVGGIRGPAAADQLQELLRSSMDTKVTMWRQWMPQKFKDELTAYLIRTLEPNLQFDRESSEKELSRQKQDLTEARRTLPRGSILVPRGKIFDRDDLEKITAETTKFRESRGWRLLVVRFVGNFFLFLGLAIAIVAYYVILEARSPGAMRRFGITSALCLLIILSGYVVVYLTLPGTWMPVGIMVGIAMLGMNRWTASFVAAIAALSGLILFDRQDFIIGSLVASLCFIHFASAVRWRTELVLRSIIAGLAGAMAFLAWNFSRGDLQTLFSDNPSLGDTMAAIQAGAGLLGNWSACGLIVVLLLPFIEWFFGTTTRIRLQSLASADHPLIRRLILEAPGTFHHCSLVSTLAESAANAIGADALMVRIGGMFHDIGKLVKPEYFTENENGISRHKTLAPSMSALLIINHVRDGAELAASFGLPNVVIDMIRQHHGNALMKYFYAKAVEQAPTGSVVAREPFTYPGPRPQSREAAVLMIADSIEAAVRSLDRPSPKHLGDLLSRLISERLTDGQFEESGLTMRDLKHVHDALYRMLVSMYHTRVKYPGQSAAQARRK